MFFFNILSYLMLFPSLGEMSIGEEEHLDGQAINDLRNSTRVFCSAKVMLSLKSVISVYIMFSMILSQQY